MGLVGGIYMQVYIYISMYTTVFELRDSFHAGDLDYWRRDGRYRGVSQLCLSMARIPHLRVAYASAVIIHS